MDRLPWELWLYMLEACAATSPEALTTLASVNKAFRTLYRAHQTSLIRTLLHTEAGEFSKAALYLGNAQYGMLNYAVGRENESRFEAGVKRMVECEVRELVGRAGTEELKNAIRATFRIRFLGSLGLPIASGANDFLTSVRNLDYPLLKSTKLSNKHAILYRYAIKLSLGLWDSNIGDDDVSHCLDIVCGVVLPKHTMVEPTKKMINKSVEDFQELHYYLEREWLKWIIRGGHLDDEDAELLLGRRSFKEHMFITGSEGMFLFMCAYQRSLASKRQYLQQWIRRTYSQHLRSGGWQLNPFSS